MTTVPARAEPTFRFAGPWWPLLVVAGGGAVLGLAGYVLLAAAERTFGVSWWLFLLAFAVGTWGAALALCGVVCLWLAFWFGLTRAVGRRVVRVAPDGLWVWRPFGWWSRFVPFASVAWVKREQPKPGLDFVCIVHGPDLITESVGRGSIRAADYDALRALLADRCPAAFTPDPPPGWRPPID